MAHPIRASTTASISEFKKNPMATIAAGKGFSVAILNRNEAIIRGCLRSSLICHDKD